MTVNLVHKDMTDILICVREIISEKKELLITENCSTQAISDI